jgi:hypothetical protein
VYSGRKRRLLQGALFARDRRDHQSSYFGAVFHTIAKALTTAGLLRPQLKRGKLRRKLKL